MMLTARTLLYLGNALRRLIEPEQGLVYCITNSICFWQCWRRGLRGLWQLRGQGWLGSPDHRLGTRDTFQWITTDLTAARSHGYNRRRLDRPLRASIPFLPQLAA